MGYNGGYDGRPIIARICSEVMSCPLYIVREKIHPVKSTEGGAKQFNGVNLKED